MSSNSWTYLDVEILLFIKPYEGPTPEVEVKFEDRNLILQMPLGDYYPLYERSKPEELFKKAENTTRPLQGSILINNPELIGLPFLVQAILYEIDHEPMTNTQILARISKELTKAIKAYSWKKIQIFIVRIS